MPTTLTNGIQLPDKGSVDWYSSMESNYNLIDTHLGNTDIHVTAEDKANWDSKQGSLSQAQIDAIAQVATNTDDIATLQSDKADVSHTHSSSDITDIDDYATKDYVDNSISGLVDNAPDALNTLNELSAALNDDSNFASTITNALGNKANSADLATVATSGDYNDLDNLPTIPTKTSDLSNDSDFVVSSNLATVATSGDYDDLSNKPSIPTNTSDLINDSDFVDTSNAAVSSGITSAKVTDYDTHIADTDIHVTTADKNKWNNQTYVFRYSSTTLVASSTNSNALLDNTDNLKVGDKVIDSSGVLFSITAIDTANSTFTIGTALIDLANDSNVVHKSGDETKSGELTVTKLISNSIQSATGNIQVQSNGSNRSVSMFNGSSAGDGGGFWAYGKDSANGSDCRLQIYNTSKSRYERIDLVGSQFVPVPSGELDCGSTSNKWKSINGINPGALSFPDFSNAIDISSYITVTGDSITHNTYTPSADGYISVNLGRSSGAIGLVLSNGKIETCVRENTFPDNHRECGGFIPVQKNDTVVITSCLADSIIWAYFIPCQGNV